MAKPQPHPSPEELLDIFEYRSDGSLLWRANRSSRARAGCRAGSAHKSGYRHIKIGSKNLKEHRIVWIMHFGPIPDGYELDHIDLNRSNNKISNLRLATRSQNRANARVQRDNSLGIKGVHFFKPDRKYVAQLRHQGRRIFLGQFRTAEEAGAAYEAAAKKYHGKFARY
jgi:hypothetical protein